MEPTRERDIAMDTTEVLAARAGPTWMDLVPDGVVAVDERGKCAGLNSRAQELLGVSPSGAVGLTLRDAFASTDNWRVMRLAEQALHDGRTVTEEVFHAAGLRWLEVEAVPSEGGVHVFLSDVSSRHRRDEERDEALSRERAARLTATRAAQALAHSEAQFRAMGETLPYGVWLADGNGMMKYVSQSFEELVGLGKAGTAGDAWLASVHPDERDLVARSWRAAVENRQLWDQDVRFVTKDGEVREVLCRGTSVTGLEDTAPQWVGLHLDITERKAKERAALQQWMSLAQENPAPVAIKDLDGRYRFANAAMHTLLGLEPGSLVGTTGEGLLPAGARTHEIAVLEGAGHAVTEEAWIGPSGLRRMMVTRFALRDFAGNATAVAIHAVDVTHQVEQLHAAASEAQQRIAGCVAHELNNILTSVIGNTRLVEEALVATGEAAELARTVLAGTERAAYLAFQLQGYSGSMMRTRRTMQPLDETRAIVEMMEGTLPDGVRLQLDIEPRCPWIEADPAYVRQIIMALINNAAEACGARGTVRVAVGLTVVGKRYRGHWVTQPVEPGRYACIEVKDNGCGMDPRTLARVFEPFFTTHPANRGMGLSMVLGLVRTCGGGLEMQSVPGEGTVVRVLIPGVKRASDEITVAPERPVRIMVLHHDGEARRAWARALLEQGHIVTPVTDVVAARRSLQLAREHCEVVFIDATHDVASAERAMVHLRRIDPGLAVVFLGCAESGELRKRLTSHGVDGFLTREPAAHAFQKALVEILGSGPARS